ncbi:MAG: hypothetical protein NC041_01815 [Bacteroides sp.]|nr:hypothetical protein [Prevotella sp.]MCM1407662.1 phosphatidate cytidylyltransferase [Treponema brennaborense]MCM1469188.1 hypothetical protein [Bacteroides sp.]
MLVLYCISEVLRFSGKNIPLISAVTQAAARKRDENRFVLGPVTLVCGVILTAVVFEPLPAAVGIYALAFGDGLASLSGKLYGHIQIPFTKGKTVAGSLTCFAAIFISAFLSVGSAGAALIIAFAGMCIELLPLKDFDNLFIPIVIALCCQVML